jgi:hypothetical protein
VDRSECSDDQPLKKNLRKKHERRFQKRNSTNFIRHQKHQNHQKHHKHQKHE